MPCKKNRESVFRLFSVEHVTGNQTLLHMKVVSLVQDTAMNYNQIDRLIVYFADNISSFEIKLNCSRLSGYKTKNKLFYSLAEIRNPKLTTSADKNTYAGLVLSSFTQYRTRWFKNKH